MKHTKTQLLIIDVAEYIADTYPVEVEQGKFTPEIVDEIVDDCIRNSEDGEDPLTRLYESDYNNDWVLGFIA